MNVTLVRSYTQKPWRSPETYNLIEKSLREKWDVASIHTTDPLALQYFLRKQEDHNGSKPFVFNIAEYLDESKKFGFLPALFEQLEVPHLGSSAEAIEIGLDKDQTKEVLRQYDIPTPNSYLSSADMEDNIAQAHDIGFPLIVKPVHEGGHIGVREDSVVYNSQDLQRIISRNTELYNQPSLVEEYVTGEDMREFSVGILGDSKNRIFVPIEIDYDRMDVEMKILSYEAAQQDLERIKLISDGKMEEVVTLLAAKTFDAVGARDYSRVDLRMDDKECYVLEINIMPGIGPHSFLPTAAEEIHGLSHNALIQKLVEDSMERQNVR